MNLDKIRRRTFDTGYWGFEVYLSDTPKPFRTWWYLWDIPLEEVMKEAHEACVNWGSLTYKVVPLGRYTSLQGQKKMVQIHKESKK